MLLQLYFNVQVGLDRKIGVPVRAAILSASTRLQPHLRQQQSGLEFATFPLRSRVHHACILGDLELNANAAMVGGACCMLLVVNP